MKTITIIEKDRVGLLLDISYILAKEKINIESISATTLGDKAIISISVKDPKKAMRVLEKNGFHVESENIIMIKLPDKPGELAKIAKLLAENKVNMRNLYIVARDGKNTIIAIQPDRPRKAKSVLKDYLVENEE